MPSHSRLMGSRMDNEDHMRWGCSQPPASMLRNDLRARQFTYFFDVIPGKFFLPCRKRRLWQGPAGMAKRSCVASTGY
jgi:hypothetical protein